MRLQAKLAADGGGTCIQTGVALAVGFFDGFEHGLVVQLGVPVVHGELRRAVIPDDVARDALAEIGLDGVHALIQQGLDLDLEPFTGGRVGESTKPMPACQKSVCQTSPLGLRTR